jgi:hypothetical protein
VYVTGGIVIAHQEGPSGESRQTYMTAPGGTTSGWLIGGGVFLARAMSVEAEWATTGWMRSRQPSRYAMTFNVERRDTLVSLLARFHIPVGGAVAIEPVAGVVITRPEAWSQTEYGSFVDDEVQIGPRVQHRIETSVGPTFGGEVRIGGRHVALVPSFRWARTAVTRGAWDEMSPEVELESIFPGGYPEWTLRGGAALRIEF